MLRLTLSLIGLMVALPNVAFAQVWPPLNTVPAVEKTGANDVALLIGVDDYLFVPDVAGAHDNVNDWANFLQRGLGVSRVTMLKNEQATREEILAAAETAASQVGPESTLWVVFVGHGAPTTDGADGYLLGVDTQQTIRSLEARGVKRSELLEVIGSGAQRRSVVVLDACFSGADASGNALVKGVQPVVATQPIATVDERVALMTAARGNQVAGALPDVDRPAFSYLILGAMRGWAEGGDQTVTVAEAVSYAERELATFPGRTQSPTVSGGVDFVLTSGVSEAPPSKEVEPPAIVVAQSPPAQIDAGIEKTSRLRLHAAAGGAAELTYETGSPLIDAGIGFRFIGKTTNFGLTAGLGFSRVTNASAQEAVDQQNDQFREAGVDLSVALNDGTRTSLLDLGVGPRLEIRSGKLDMFGDVRVGVALPIGGECTEWQVGEQGTNEVRLDCSARDGGTGLATTPRLGVRYGVVEVAATAKLLPRRYTVYSSDSNGQVIETEASKTLFVAGLTLGVAFDL